MLHSQTQKERGFTLIEYLLAVAVIIFIFGISYPFYERLQARNEFTLTVDHAVATLQRAQVLAQSVYLDDEWGMHVETGSITLFRGDDWNSRDTSYDEEYTFPQSITTSGVGEVTFTKLEGLPSATGNILFTSRYNDTKTITINEKGKANLAN